MANKLNWFEVLGNDPRKLRAFYSELFGWQFIDEPDGEYATVSPEQSGIGVGIGKAREQQGGTTVFASVPDLKASIAQAERLGGRLLLPIKELPELAYAVVADPEGHPIGLLTMK